MWERKCPSLPDVGDRVLPCSGNWQYLGGLCRGTFGDHSESPGCASRATGARAPQVLLLGGVSLQAAAWVVSQRRQLTVPGPHCPMRDPLALPGQGTNIHET